MDLATELLNYSKQDSNVELKISLTTQRLDATYMVSLMDPYRESKESWHKNNGVYDELYLECLGEISYPEHLKKVRCRINITKPTNNEYKDDSALGSGFVEEGNSLLFNIKMNPHIVKNIIEKKLWIDRLLVNEKANTEGMTFRIIIMNVGKIKGDPSLTIGFNIKKMYF